VAIETRESILCTHIIRKWPQNLRI
jgi:hypothetical protein